MSNLDKRQFCKDFVNAVNADPLHELAVHTHSSLSVSEALDLVNSKELSMVPDFYKIKFINHLQDIKNNRFPTNKVRIYKK